MTDGIETGSAIEKARGDVAAERACLRCTMTFWSDSFGERICRRCKRSAAWRSAVSVSTGQSRRRSSARTS
jgi:hypothetical protein